MPVSYTHLDVYKRQVHRSAGDYLGAESYFLSFIEQERNENNLYSGYLALGNLYLYMNRLEDAKMYLALCLKSPNLVIKRDACECLYDLEKELDNFKGAIGYKDIADSLRIITQDIDCLLYTSQLSGSSFCITPFSVV